MVGSVEQIFQKEGLRGMYRGLAPIVLVLLHNWTVSCLFHLSILSRFNPVYRVLRSFWMLLKNGKNQHLLTQWFVNNEVDYFSVGVDPKLYI